MPTGKAGVARRRTDGEAGVVLVLQVKAADENVNQGVVVYGNSLLHGHRL